LNEKENGEKQYNDEKERDLTKLKKERERKETFNGEGKVDQKRRRKREI
jgi:hypothetical protein